MMKLKLCSRIQLNLSLCCSIPYCNDEMYQMMIVASEDIIGIIDKGVTDYTIFNLHNLRRILSRINNNVSYTRKTKKEDRN
jgi:hypothetical protein